MIDFDPPVLFNCFVIVQLAAFLLVKVIRIERLNPIARLALLGLVIVLMPVIESGRYIANRRRVS